MRKLSFIFTLVFALNSFAVVPADTPVTATTVPQTLVTVNPLTLRPGVNDQGVLPQSKILYDYQKGTKRTLERFVTGGVAGVACWLAATEFGCEGYTCPLVAGSCAIVAAALISDIEGKMVATRRAEDEVTTNPTTSTIYNRPDGEVPPDVSVGPENPRRPPSRGPIVRTPGGRSFPLGSLGNDAAMAAAGFTPQEISNLRAGAGALNATLPKELAKDGLDKGLSLFDDGMGAGGGSASGRGNPGDANPAIRDPAGGGAGQRDTVVTTGLARRCGDSMCGTSNDGIFVMINRRIVQQCTVDRINCR